MASLLRETGTTSKCGARKAQSMTILCQEEGMADRKMEEGTINKVTSKREGAAALCLLGGRYRHDRRDLVRKEGTTRA